jgi:CHAT domain-containing protein
MIAVAFLAARLWAQCPTGNLWARLVELRQTEKNPEKQLRKLLTILDSVNHCSYADDSTHSFLLARVARTYVEQGDFLKGVQYYKEAVKVITNNSKKASVNLKHLPGRYYWLSVAYDSLGNFAERIKALDSCLSTSMRLNFVDRSTLTSIASRVQYYFDVGDYETSVNYATKWESLAREYAKDNVGLERSAGEASAKSSLGWRVKALLQLQRLEQADELLKNKIDEYKKSRLKDYLAMIYGQLAQVQEQKRDYRKALTYYEQSFEYYQEIRDYFNCKQTAKDIGNIYFRHFNDYGKARVYFIRGLGYITNDKSEIAKDASESLAILGSIANICTRKGGYDSAHYYFQLAFDQLKPGMNETKFLRSSPEDLMKIKKIDYLARLIIDKGDAYRDQYETTRQVTALNEAIRIYKVADLFLNRIKTEQSDFESKLFWRSDSRRLYENAIAACYLVHDIDAAFYFFEKSRAVLLQDQLNEQRWLGESDIMRQTQLSKKILQLERQLKNSDGSAAHHSDLQNQLFNDKQELERVRELVKTDNPLYFQNFIDSTSFSITDVRQKILKDHQALVEIFSGDSALYVLIITAQKSYFGKIDKIIFDRLAVAYSEYIAHPDLLNANFDNYVRTSQQLYHLMFNNAELPPGRIIISPDGRYFPFESLVTNKQPVTYFVEDYAVSYTYSARYLLSDFFSNSTRGTRGFLGIAPLHYTNGLAALPGSDQSLHRMEKYFSNATDLVGAKATKDNFLTRYFSYKIIQLYTHATDSGSSGDPMIYFADSPLSLSDLFYENRPATDLIVLSACETANGKLYNGEGVFSFNRQFAALGIPSSVANLWKTDNQSCYRITELFYKYLAEGLPIDVALQSAKKEFIHSSGRENKLPYYWAAPILVGQSGAISLPKTFPWAWATALGLLALLAVGGWRARKIRIQKIRNQKI